MPNDVKWGKADIVEGGLIIEQDVRVSDLGRVKVTPPGKLPSKPGKRLRQSRIEKGIAVLLLILFGAYWLATLIYVSPNNPIRAELTRQCYAFELFFFQDWNFFAPPPETNQKIVYLFEPKRPEYGKTYSAEVSTLIAERKRKFAPFNEPHEIADYLINGAAESISDARLQLQELQSAAYDKYLATNRDDPVISPRNIISLDGFVDCLRHPAEDDRVSKYLYHECSLRTKMMLKDYFGGINFGLQEALAHDLSHIMTNGPLYDADRFVNVKLPEELSEEIGKVHDREAMIQLNRDLLFAVYPSILSADVNEFSPIVSPNSYDPSVQMLKEYAWYVCRNLKLDPARYRASIYVLDVPLPKFKDRARLLDPEKPFFQKDQKVSIMIRSFEIPTPMDLISTWK